MSAVYTIFTSPDHPAIVDHLPTLIVTPHGKPQQILYTYLHTNYNRENYLLTPSPQGDLCVAKLFPPPSAASQLRKSASEGHGSASNGAGSTPRTVKCEASRNFRWSITNSGVLTPTYKCTLPADDGPGGMEEEQPLFQISKTNPQSPFWTMWYYAYAGHLIPPKRIQFGHISKSITPDGKPVTGGGTRVTITGKSDDEKAVWKTLGDGNEDMVEWAVICAALHVLDDEIVKAAEAAGIRIGVLPGSNLKSIHHSSTPPPMPHNIPRPQLHPTGQPQQRAATLPLNNGGGMPMSPNGPLSPTGPDPRMRGGPPPPGGDPRMQQQHQQQMPPQQRTQPPMQLQQQRPGNQGPPPLGQPIIPPPRQHVPPFPNPGGQGPPPPSSMPHPPPPGMQSGQSPQNGMPRLLQSRNAPRPQQIPQQQHEQLLSPQPQQQQMQMQGQVPGSSPPYNPRPGPLSQQGSGRVNGPAHIPPQYANGRGPSPRPDMHTLPPPGSIPGPSRSAPPPSLNALRVKSPLPAPGSGGLPPPGGSSMPDPRAMDSGMMNGYGDPSQQRRPSNQPPQDSYSNGHPAPFARGQTAPSSPQRNRFPAPGQHSQSPGQHLPSRMSDPHIGNLPPRRSSAQASQPPPSQQQQQQYIPEQQSYRQPQQGGGQRGSRNTDDDDDMVDSVAFMLGTTALNDAGALGDEEIGQRSNGPVSSSGPEPSNDRNKSRVGRLLRNR